MLKRERNTKNLKTERRLELKLNTPLRLLKTISFRKRED